MQLRALGLTFAIIGIFLMSFLIFAMPKEVDKISEENFHEVVAFSGLVTKERISNEQHYFNVGDIPVRCSCKTLYLEGKNVKIVGFVDEYQEKIYVRVLRLVIL